LTPLSLAVLLALGAAILLPAGDALAKALSTAYPIVMIAWCRFGVTLIVISVTARLHRVSLLRSDAMGLQLLRAVLAVATISFFYTGLRYLPLAETTAVVFIAPLVAIVIAWVWLKEDVPLLTWFGLGMSLFGVALIVRPGATLYQWAALWPLLAALALGGFYAITRKLAPLDGALSTTFLTTLFAFVAFTALLPVYWQTPQTFTDYGLLIGVGVLGATGQQWMAMAYQRADTSLVAPLGYLSAVFAVALGWMMFNEVPDMLTAAGMLLIIAAGVATLRRLP